MKFRVWTLLLSFFLWSVGLHDWAPKAFAGTTLSGEQSGTTVNSPKVTTLPPPAPAQTQVNSEQQTKDLNKQGQQQSNMLGMMAIAAGMALIAAGIAMMPPPCSCGAPLIAAGVALMIAGMLGLQAGQKMGNNANTAQGLGTNMSNISSPPLKSVKINDDQNGGFKIDPSLARNEKAKSTLAELEKKTGIKPEDFLKGLEEGKTPAQMLGEQKKFGTAEQIQAMMDKYGANAQPLSQSEVMEKLGVTDKDLEGLGSDENAYALGAGSANKKAGEGNPDLAALLGGPGPASLGDGSVSSTGAGALSADVQAALDKNGITGRTVFDMVRSQYKKKTPVMFGVTQKKIAPPTDNPFANLSGGGIEL